MGDRSFACLEGEEHRTMRKLTARSVNGTPTLVSYMPLIESVAKDEFEKWAELGEISLLKTCKKVSKKVLHITSVFGECVGNN